MRTDIAIKRPIITEKTMLLAQKGQFTFEVDKNASKQQIAKIITDNFKVTIEDIKTSAIKGKSRRFGRRRQESKLSDSKKAIITLKKGQKIDYFDVVEEK